MNDPVKVVTVYGLSELRPGDMVREGVFLHSIYFGPDFSWDVAHAWMVEVEVEGGTYLDIEWGAPLDIKPEFPMTVVRGVSPPCANWRGA